MKLVGRDVESLIPVYTVNMEIERGYLSLSDSKKIDVICRKRCHDCLIFTHFGGVCEKEHNYVN